MVKLLVKPVSSLKS
jgi:ABC-type iron transport system FetAB ATPase subunit